MTTSNEINDLLDALSKVLLRCALFGFLLLLLWSGLCTLAGDLVYGLHGRLFDLTRHELSLIHYSGMAFTKICVLIFFLFPYIAIRLVLHKRW
ncbi:MAG: hypothetical protein A2107_14790 [Verrucomicrobia bacterium GWF2_62_7]|nr:MAG: hypothetical protein A2107_14790 [Verrucomicrobia bacterium GWF2_62_7]